MFETLTGTTSLLGECPVWCERTERLFWTDIPGCELLALDPFRGQVQRWSLSEPLGSFALTVDEDVLLMGLASCLGYYNLPLHPVSAERIHAYLEPDIQREPGPGPLFRSIRGRTTGTGICPDGIYKVVAQWAKAADIHIEGLGVHGLRATTATNALEHVEGGGP